MPRKILPELRQRRTYSEDLKKRVIYQRFTLERTVNDIAVNLDMPKRVVERVLQIWKDTGEVELESGKKKKRLTIMTDDEKEFLLALSERHPDIYLDEFQEQLRVQHGIILGLATIWKTLTSLGLTRKKLSKAAAERNEADRARSRFQIGAESPERLVFVDESRVDLRTTYRLNGWAPKGERAAVTAKFQRGQGYSLLPALCSEGIIYSEIQKGAYDRPSFLTFIENLLEHMNPWPAPRSVLVMDNCSIHHLEDVETLCNNKGVALYYLPAYSPDLNPIEESFSFVKAHLRRNGFTFRATMQG
ncbi:hypothetical protein M422DRAFT_226531 [Sphaerobolus stellatus SS14]|uniref:Tc1-like transposase DDE domain-containing protein n=1 Tax=Sphaerobolus stellatus (strain SS14) TaxID=990650 RepID=A0A0C9W529_SPHS4|nr:hypothetical protein M422DRAFT_226531 [Sphaerobolus stellatus SS14]